MNKEKQIEEMAVIVSNSIREWAHDLPPISCPVYNAEAIYNAGYRKQSEVAREILKEARQAVLSLVLANAMGENFDLEKRFAEIEKKYTKGE